MEFWCTDHGRDLSVLSIRTPDNGKIVTPVVSQVQVRGDWVTTIGILDDEDLRDLKDAIDAHLQEKHGDAL